MTIKEVLDLLENKIAEFEFQFRFNKPANMEVVEVFEKDFMLKLPSSYKEFLKRYNGGFICSGAWEEYIWETGNSSLPRERSVYLFTIEELIEEYKYYDEYGVDLVFDDGTYSMTPIPIGRTISGDIIVIREMPVDDHESAVYDGGSGQIKEIRKVYASGFTRFLLEYIEEEGNIMSVKEEAQAKAEAHEREVMNYPGKEAYIKIREFSKNYEIMNFFSDYMKSNPSDSNIYCFRAKQYLLEKDFHNAIIDCDKAIGLSPKNLWARYLRLYILYLISNDKEALSESIRINKIEKRNPK